MGDTRRVLIVDDEPSMREMLAIMLRKEGYVIETAEGRVAAAAALARATADAVITDVRLGDGDGIEILRHVKAASPETVVIVMTAYGSTETAVAALKLGAYDYLVKPFDVDELKIVLRNALERQRLQEENRILKAEFRTRAGLDRILGISPAMTALFEMIRSVATTSSTVLITGESGTGKELVAKALHAQSPRQGAPFVSVNCGALTETLLESELFGHVKGAFTDAHQSRKGLFEAAHRGTLFLDEVGETTPAMQVKLLRVLQEKRIRRVGGTEETDVDVRIIAATNRSLEQLVEEGRFREDLFYRLSVIPIRLPALRERREDIPLLAAHFLERFAREMGKGVTRLAEEALGLLQQHDWPGNVRELENVMERAVALETSPVVLPERLPRGLGRTSRGGGDAATRVEPGDGFDLDAYLRGEEARLLRLALDRAAGDRGEAARLLGVSARSLRYLIGKHQLGEA
ncbi:MAG: sigma-54 dependent transcriptional regulator [Vicinamibacteria bacterium]|nr:sigma-54 dependent transcriptional regulator [Vicinamibacteria bacterium]